MNAFRTVCRLVLGGWMLMFAARATSVQLVLQPCPACDKPFVVHALMSYNTFGLVPERDLRDQVLFRFGAFASCPHCLYTACEPDFENLETSARKKLRAGWTVDLLPEEKTWLGADPERVPTEAWLARACNAVRKQTIASRVTFQRALFYAAPDDRLRAIYRGQLIGLLQTGMTARAFDREDAVVFTYLTGELKRQAGRRDEAFAVFAEARALFQKLPAALREPEAERSLFWVDLWSEAQTLRMRLETQTVAQIAALLREDGGEDPRANERKLAAWGTLAARPGPSAWAALHRDLAGRPERLENILEQIRPTPAQLRIDSNLWNWCETVARSDTRAGRIAKSALQASYSVQPTDGLELARWLAASDRDVRVSYAIRPGDSLTSIADAHRVDLERLYELNPGLPSNALLRAGASLWIPNRPAHWGDYRMVEALCAEMKRTNRAAFRHADRLIRSYAGHRGDGRAYCVMPLLLAAGGIRLPSPWVWSDEGDAMRAACGDRDAADRLVLALSDSATSWPRFVALSALAAGRDRRAIPPLLAQVSGQATYDQLQQARRLLSRIGTTAELPHLEANLPEEPYRRDDVESIIRAIRLRALVAPTRTATGRS